MTLLFRKLLDVRNADAKLPGDVPDGAASNSLYAPFASLVVGAVAGGLVGAMASTDPGSWLTACSAAIFLVGLARVLSALAYRRRRDRPGRGNLAGACLRARSLGYSACSACNACWP